MDFSNFYKATIKYVYFYFYSRTNDRYVSEDLCHNVYLDFYNKYSDKESDEEQSIKILYGFCRIAYKDYVRNSSKLKEISYNDEIHVIDSNRINKKKYSQKNKSILNNYIKSLSPVLKRVLELRFIDGLNRRDTAVALNISLASVHTYQKRAIKKLKEQLR